MFLEGLQTPSHVRGLLAPQHIQTEQPSGLAYGETEGKEKIPQVVRLWPLEDLWAYGLSQESHTGWEHT